MGEDAKDIPTEDYFAERKRIKMEERRGRRERVEKYRSERDSRRSGRRDGRYEERRRDNREERRTGKPGSKDIRRDGSVKERKGKFHFDMNEKPDRRELTKESFQKVKTLPQKKEKKPENKISMKEYSKRFKF